VLEWLDRLSRLALQTRRNALNLLRVALQEAVDRDLMPANPARDVRLEGSEAKDTDDLEGILTPDEQRRLLETAPSADHLADEVAEELRRVAQAARSRPKPF
jgi:hypothetical protein